MLLVVKNLPANAGDVRDSSLIPGLGRSPRARQGNPLQYSCLEDPMDRGAWRATAHRVAMNWAQPKGLRRYTRVREGNRAARSWWTFLVLEEVPSIPLSLTQSSPRLGTGPMLQGENSSAIRYGQGSRFSEGHLFWNLPQVL